MKIKNLNHISILVTDLDRSIKFYKEVLLLEQKPRPNFSFPGAWFKLGNNAQELHLIQREEETPPTKTRSSHFALEVESAKEAIKHLDEKGATHKGIKQRPDGYAQIFVQDPDGYYIELTELG